MCVLIFSTTFVWNISHSKKNPARYYHKCAQVFMQSDGCSCQILMELEFFREFFQKYSNIRFHDNQSSGTRVVPWRRTDGRTDGQTDRQTDRHDGTNSRFLQFSNSPKTERRTYLSRKRKKNPIPVPLNYTNMRVINTVQRTRPIKSADECFATDSVKSAIR
jgi:hypothetical protein